MEMEQMRFQELKVAVEAWASERGIYEHSTATAQLLKAVSEMGELADAHGKRDETGEIDAVGDVLVCLINFCAMRGMDITGCLYAAWEQIKDRKGHMVEGGTFVKEAA